MKDLKGGDVMSLWCYCICPAIVWSSRRSGFRLPHIPEIPFVLFALPPLFQGCAQLLDFAPVD